VFLVLAATGCNPFYDPARDYTFNAPLPPETLVSSYRSEDDVLVVTAEVQSRAVADGFLKTASFSGSSEAPSWIFDDLKRVLRDSGVKQQLKNQGWAMERNAYTVFDGVTKSGRNVHAFQSADGLDMLFWIAARGG
jgi:hypothetical protein